MISGAENFSPGRTVAEKPDGPIYPAYVLASLTAVYSLNLVDRGLVALFLQPIKEDLRLSDTQLGMMTGIAFALFYATLGLPIARWADRGNRVTITAFSIGLWGLAMMTCTLIGNFAQMLAFRVAAAIGEAGCKPPSYSLLGDYFPGSESRTRAMSVYWLANPLSSLCAFVVGGWLSTYLGWRLTFAVMGLPALLLAILVKTTIREPRTLSDPTTPAAASIPYRAVMRTIWRVPSCRNVTIGFILLATQIYGLATWNGAFLIRSHGMAVSELGLWLGLISSLGGIVGTLLGGHLAVRFFGGDDRGQLRMSAIGIALTIPCYMLFTLVPDRTGALVALLMQVVLSSLYFGPVFALLQRLVPDEMRATSLAVVMLLYNLIGMGLGPQLVGLLSDALAPAFAGQSLRYALLIMSVIGLGTAWFFLRAGRTVRDDLAEMDASRRDATSAGASA